MKIWDDMNLMKDTSGTSFHSNFKGRRKEPLIIKCWPQALLANMFLSILFMVCLTATGSRRQAFSDNRVMLAPVSYKALKLVEAMERGW